MDQTQDSFGDLPSSSCEIDSEVWREDEATWSRRWFLAALAGSLTACQTAAPSRLVGPPSTVPFDPDATNPFDLMEVAASHVDIAEASRRTDSSYSTLWGRLGGSPAEGASADLLQAQLRPWVHEIAQESFTFDVARPDQWRLTISGETNLSSAVPAPVDARFPDGSISAPIQAIHSEEDWNRATGRWAFLLPRAADSIRRNPARDVELYMRAHRARVGGIIFALPTPDGTWRTSIRARVSEIERISEQFPGGFHPLPCFCVDAEDGIRLADAARTSAELTTELIYDPRPRQSGSNVTALLRRGAPRQTSTLWNRVSSRSRPATVAILANLDSVFSGASDNASGLAVLVGLAQTLAKLPAPARRADIYFVGLSAQQDAGAGLKAFAEADPVRMNRIRQFYFLQRTDGQPGEGVDVHGRVMGSESRAIHPVAFLGKTSWGSLGSTLPAIFAESRMPGTLSQIVQRSGFTEGIQNQAHQKQVFCLDRSLPYAGTDHDTIDKLSGEGLGRSVDFHLRLMETAGNLTPGTFREALRPPAPNRNRA